MAFSFGGLGPERFFRYILYIFSNALLEGLATQICHFYFLSLSANLFAYLTFFFSLFSLFGLLDILIFSSTLPLYPHPFRTFYLPWKTAWLQISIITCSPLVPAANIDISPIPLFIFIPIPDFLSFFLVRKFLFLTYFFLFYLILSPAYFFVSFFSFSLLSSKIGSKDFLILGWNLSCQPLDATLEGKILKIFFVK